MKKLKSLLWGLFALAISGLFGWMLQSEVKELYELSIYGVKTTGIVTDYKYKERTGRKGRIRREYNHLISRP